MTSLTVAEKALVNSQPQQTKLFLSIYEPAISMICQITGSYDTALQTVGYTNVTTGSYVNVTDFLFQVALIGTTEGGDEKGRTWVRSITNNQIRFVESDHINWAAGDWITILRYTEIIPVYPRIIQNPADEEDVIFYKIFDIAYTNQNEILGTFICMGSNYAGFLDPATHIHQVYWSASGSYNLLEEGITCFWEFDGGTPATSSDFTPGWVTYSAPGHYRTLLKITSASGREDYSMRYVSIYDRPEYGTNVPILNWHFTDAPSGSRDSNGYKFGIRIRGNANDTKIRDGSVVVVFADEWYGGVKQSINGNLPNWGSVKFVGYITDGTIHRNYKDNYIDFDVLSPTGVMELGECYSCSINSSSAPSTWYELLNMDVRRALYHYYAWQSTLLLCADFEFPHASEDRYLQFFDADRESLLSAGDNLIWGARRGHLVSDRYGKIWAEQDYSVITGSYNYFNHALEISKSDILEEPIIDEQIIDQTSFLEWGGIFYDPASNTPSAFLCDAPGASARYRGKIDRKQGFALASQAELNQMAGQSLATDNARYPNNEFLLRGNFANLDIAPQELLLVTLKPEDTGRGVDWQNKPFALRKIDWIFDKEALLPRVTVSEVVNGFPGITILIPDVPPDGDTGGKPPNPPFPPNIPYPGLSGSLLGLDIYDEHILLARGIKALDIIGPNVYTLVSGTVAYIIHTEGGGETGTSSTGTSYGCHGYWLYESTGSSLSYSQYILGSDYVDNPTQETYDNGGFFTGVTNYTFKAPADGYYAISVNIIPNITFYTTDDSFSPVVCITGMNIRLTDPGNSDRKMATSVAVNNSLGPNDVWAISGGPVANFAYSVYLNKDTGVSFRIEWYFDGINGAYIRTDVPYQPQINFEADVYATWMGS